ncbi:MAG TPA: subclass B3 metallo-beta-lactamase [Bryobacterales bacterium]|nr:subclass B3 metallo-beta-lactamase [Bryobacterales bacterium]
MEVGRRRFLLGLLGAPLAAQLSRDKPFPPHKVIGNVYYVGSADLASFLITTPQGHILVNSSFEETVPLIRAGVGKLGFRFGDIKILLDSHAHGDHVAGNALVKRLTGAKVMAMAGDAEVISSGSAGPACPVDRVLHDGDTVSLGGMTLTAHLTPGHTKGCTSWSFTAEDGGKPYRVVIVGSLSVNPGYILVNNRSYPQIAADYERSFRVLKALPCDVFLAPHGEQYGLDAKFARLERGGANPFIDPEGYRAYVETSEEKFRRELERQKRGRR